MLQQRGQVRAEVDRGEPLAAAEDVADWPPAKGPDDLRPRHHDVAGVDVVADHPHQEESLELALGSSLPREYVVAGPDRWPDCSDVDCQSSLLQHLTYKSRLVGLTRLERAARREPPGIAVGQLAAKEQHPFFGVDDQRTSAFTEGRHRRGTLHRERD